jgi:hypothetical protein
MPSQYSLIGYTIVSTRSVGYVTVVVNTPEGSSIAGVAAIS